MAGAAGSDDVAVLDYALTLVDDGDALGGEGRLESLVAGHSEAASGFHHFFQRQH